MADDKEHAIMGHHQQPTRPHHERPQGEHHLSGAAWQQIVKAIREMAPPAPKVHKHPKRAA